jgi:Domain of Unknown Function (DUF928)
MTNNHLPSSKKKLRNLKLTSIIFTLLLGVVNYPLLEKSQAATPPNNSVIQKSKSLPDVKFPGNSTAKDGQPINITNNDVALSLPSNGTPTGRRKGGGRRDDGCPNFSQPLTALVPGEEKSNESHLAYTVSNYPTFWIYIPQRPETVKYGEFSLQDKDGKKIYEAKLTLPKESGIIGIKVPNKPEYILQENHKYRWFFTLFCDEEKNSSVDIDAWIQRVPLTPYLETQLKSFKTYGNNNIWYDTLTILAEKKLTNSNLPEAINAWMHLLKSVDLGELASTPIIMTY